MPSARPSCPHVPANIFLLFTAFGVLTFPMIVVRYAGLKNLGCICYMNSTLQQFFMIKGFREGILSFVDPDAEQTGDRDESLMFQLQTLFAHLQETHKGYYNPKVNGPHNTWGGPLAVMEAWKWKLCAPVKLRTPRSASSCHSSHLPLHGQSCCSPGLLQRAQELGGRADGRVHATGRVRVLQPLLPAGATTPILNPSGKKSITPHRSIGTASPP